MGSRGPAKGCGGRPRKPLAEKLLEGNRSKRPIKVLKQFDEISSLEAADVPEPSLYLSQLQKDGKPFGADEIYKRVWLWLKERKCEKFVSSDTIEHYAVMAARAVQCTRSVSEFGLLSKGSKGNIVESPFVSLEMSYTKQAEDFWKTIYSIVEQNASEVYGGSTPEDDLMTQLLNS